MVTARDVAAYLEERLPGIDGLALYELLYYVQAWHIAWEGTALFPDRVEAWSYGPVTAQLWRERARDLPHPTPEPLPEAVRVEVDSIVAFYAYLPAYRLIQLTHSEAPWREARGDLPEYAKSEEEVTVASMRRFYTRKAMSGDEVPRRPIVDEPHDQDGLMAAVAREVPRWQQTLDRLTQ